MQNSIQVPDHIKGYLWDINLDQLDVQRHSKYIIEKVLEYGNKKDIKWINETYTRDTIVDTLKKSKRISTKTGTFYAIYYDIPKEELECIKKPFTQKQNRF